MKHIENLLLDKQNLLNILSEDEDGFYSKYCEERLPKYVDKDIMEKFSSIREASKNEPIRRLIKTDTD